MTVPLSSQSALPSSSSHDDDDERHSDDNAYLVPKTVMAVENEPLLRGSDIKTHIPQDRYYFVYVIFYILGIGSLLPFNFFSNARQYFVFKLRTNISISDKEWIEDPSQYNHFQSMFVPYVAMASMVPNVLFMFINAAFTKVLSVSARMVGAMVCMIMMFMLTVLLTKINTDHWQTVFFAITLITVFIMNAGSAVLQGGLFGLSSMFPKEYTQSVMSGMSMGGVIAALANILAIWLSTDITYSGLGYFLTALLVTISAMAGFLCLRCSTFAVYFMEVGAMQTSHLRINETAVSEIGASGEIVIPKRNGITLLLTVFKKIWVYAVSVFFVFFITLSCFPAINSKIFSVDIESKKPSQWAVKYFIPVTCFLLFNVMDFTGRTVGGLLQWPREGSPLIPILCLLRVVFIPLFLMCNVLPHSLLPRIFHNDIVPSVIMMAFALSNGYLGTLCMMYGPRKVIETENVELAGSVMSIFLSLGLAIGSALSFLLVSIA